jgi:cation transport ATPase
MTHTYKVTGMTCGSCETRVKSSLLDIPHVSEVQVSKETQSASIKMDQHIPVATFQKALDEKYVLTEMEHLPGAATMMQEEAEQKSWWDTYKPIVLIFAYISSIAIIAATRQNTFNWMQAMNVFMAGFFLTFSFFKMLDLEGFAESYSMYDIVAKKIKAWGYIYAFVELALGIAYATNVQPVFTNIVTLVVMGVSIVGVLQSVINKRKIKCACLGAVFNLPMSTVTIIEDGLMIVMSSVMLYTMF